MPNNFGYIGRNPDDTSVIVARQQFVASGVTTTLTFAAGYTPGYIDAYINGVRQLEGTDYNATDSTTVSFDTPLANNDNVELVAYKAYDVVAPSSLGNLTVSGNLTVTGLTTTTANTGNIGIGGSILSDVTVVGNARVVGVLTVGSGPITIDPGDNSITGVSTLGITSAYFEIPTAPASFPRNLIINGDQRISQRRALGVTTIGNNYVTDRFLIQANTAAHVVGMGSTGNGLPTRKLQHYLRMENVTAENATDSYAQIRYIVDSLDLANFGWDTQDPESKIIVSWYSRSSIDLTGAMLFILPLNTYNGVTRRMYTHEFTQSANTWTHHYVVVPGDSSLIPGTQFNDQESTRGGALYISPHYGSDFTDNSATLDQWKDFISSSYVTDMPQDWRNTAGATFDLTGVQIEVAQQGQTRPTPFEHIPFDMSLQRCQRYLYRVQGGGGDGRVIGVGLARDNQDIRCVVPLPTTMRDNEGDITESGLDCMYRTVNTDVSMISSQNEGKNAVALTLRADTGTPFTPGDSIILRVTDDSTAFFQVDAEF